MYYKFCRIIILNYNILYFTYFSFNKNTMNLWHEIYLSKSLYNAVLKFQIKINKNIEKYKNVIFKIYTIYIL